MIIIDITDTAYRGNGVGKDDSGKAVFVPYTVTGDRVAVNITNDKGSYLSGECVDVLESSPLRVEPHCKYHGVCGGCHFGHISYTGQIEIKKNIILQALRKHPQAAEFADMLEIFTAEPLDYRIRATVRTKGSQAGFFAKESNNFISVDNCPVIKTSLYEKCSRWAKETGYKGLCLISALESPDGKVTALADTMGRNVRINSAGLFDGFSCNRYSSGISHMEYSTPYGIVPVDHGAFFQANRFLINSFQEYAAGGAIGNTLELYAGSGFFTSAILKMGCRVTAAELNPSASILGRKYGYPILSESADNILRESEQYDTIFVDPPREGIDKKSMEAILRIQPSRFVYVSCNPMTLARDLNRLSQNYTVKKFAFFDMFPQTFHIETVSILDIIK